MQANYRVSPNREQRALAGLSRGGAQTLNIGPKHLDLFQPFGSVQRGGSTNAETSDFNAKNASVLNSKLKLLWSAWARKTRRLQTQTGFQSF